MLILGPNRPAKLCSAADSGFDYMYSRVGPVSQGDSSPLAPSEPHNG